MRTFFKIATLGALAVLMLVLDLAFLPLVDEAEAIAGVRRRTARRTAVIVGSSTAAAASASTAAAQQQAAASQQQAASAEAEAEAAKQQAASAEADAQAAKQQATDAQAQADAYKQQAESAQAAATAAGVLPLGTVVNALPDGCTTMTSGGVQYYSCAGNYYRAAFQGSQLVYVTSKP